MADLAGQPLPDVDLLATGGGTVNPARQPGRAVYVIYPYTGQPGTPDPPGWDGIAGAHGSTPQLRAYSTACAAFATQGVKLFGLSLQTTAWQQAFVARNALAFPLLSDEGRAFSHHLKLATFVAGETAFLVRRTLLAVDGVVRHDRQAVPTPEGDAADMLRVVASLA